MTFQKYWKDKGHFGCDPEEVAELAWNAATQSLQQRFAELERDRLRLDWLEACHFQHGHLNYPRIFVDCDEVGWGISFRSGANPDAEDPEAVYVRDSLRQCIDDARAGEADCGCAGYIAQIDALEQRLAEAERDRKRMDWLERRWRYRHPKSKHTLRGLADLILAREEAQP